MAIVWTQQLALGLPELDDQHRELFAHAETYRAALRRVDPTEKLEEYLHFLVDYADRHFEAEERFMRDIGFPGLATHKAEHDDFRRRLEMLAPLEEQEGPSSAVLEVVKAMEENWFQHHVEHSDMAYVRWWAIGRRDAVETE